MLLFSSNALCSRHDASRTTDPCATCQLMSRSCSSLMRSRLQHALELAESSVQSAAAHPSRICQSHARLWLGTLLTHLRELRRAEEVLEASNALSGIAGMAGRADLARAFLAFTAGNIDASAQLSEQGLAKTERSGPWRTLGQLVMAGCALRRADMKGALANTQQIAEDALMASPNPLAGLCAWVSIQVREAHSGAEAVAPFIEQLVDLGPTSREILASQPAAGPWFVRLALKVGDQTAAQQAALGARQLVVNNPEFRSLRAAALHAKGLLESDLDDLWQAAEQHVDLWARASALEDIGAHLASRSLQRDGAIQALERASDAYLTAGAARDLSRVKSRLRSLGVRHHISRWSNGSKDDLGQLTETERAVALLVVQGMTNNQVATQLFLSHHTVAFHLKKIFRKLNVTSRVELARKWSTRVSRTPSSS